MFDVQFIEGMDGEPLVRVTLTAGDVQGIHSALFTRAREHTDRVFQHVTSGVELDPAFRGVEAQAESNYEAGTWSVINDVIGDRFMDWVSEEECTCGEQ